MGPWALVGFLAITVAGILRPAWNLKPVAFAAMACALVAMGSFEWIREAARRPYVIGEFMYSKRSEGGGERSPCRRLPAVGPVGAEPCGYRPKNSGRPAGSSLSTSAMPAIPSAGFNNDIVSRTATMSYPALTTYIGRMHEIRPFMPPFAGSDSEARALAAYIVGDLHGKEDQRKRWPRGRGAGQGPLRGELLVLS